MIELGLRPSGSGRWRASAARRPTACRRPAAPLGEHAETCANTRSRFRFCAARARGSIAPISRFSSTVSVGNTWRPSATWPMPRSQTRCDGQPAMSTPRSGCGRARAHAGDGADQRGLAGAVGADDGDDLALRDLERDAVERLGVAVEEVEILDREHQPRASVAEIDIEHGRVAHDLCRRALGDDLAVVQHHDCCASAMTARMTCSISRMVRPVSRLRSRRNADHPVDLGRPQAGHHLVEQQQLRARWRARAPLPAACGRAGSGARRAGRACRRGRAVAGLVARCSRALATSALAQQRADHDVVQRR